MIFLIEYKRSAEELVTFRRYEESQRQQARRDQLDLELDRNRHRIENEIVILEADDEATIRRTHRRYFESMRQLLNSAAGNPPLN